MLWTDAGMRWQSLCRHDRTLLDRRLHREDELIGVVFAAYRSIRSINAPKTANQISASDVRPCHAVCELAHSSSTSTTIFNVPESCVSPAFSRIILAQP